MDNYILSLFFTRGVSLKTWVDIGLFEREKQIYETHLESGNFKKIYWLTYGSDDYKIAKNLKKQGKLHSNIFVYSMPKFFNIPKLGSYLYSLLMPLVNYKPLRNSSFLKTNQIDGSWSAVLAKWLYQKPLVVRSGYLLSQLENKLERCSSIKLKIFELVEKIAYESCDVAVVTSKHNKKYLIGKYNLKPSKINIITNYIDTNKFFANFNVQKEPNKIIFVGRLSPEKNIYNLINAIIETNLVLDIYGQGPLKEELKSYAINKKAKVNFMGVVPNSKLPKILNSYQYYILPSFYEGMPKTLLEAMACGLVCIGTDVAGINEVIEDKLNGYLSKSTKSNDIYNTIVKSMGLESKEIIKNGIKTIENNYSLKYVKNLESKIFGKLSNDQ